MLYHKTSAINIPSSTSNIRWLYNNVSLPFTKTGAGVESAWACLKLAPAYATLCKVHLTVWGLVETWVLSHCKVQASCKQVDFWACTHAASDVMLRNKSTRQSRFGGIGLQRENVVWHWQCAKLFFVKACYPAYCCSLLMCDVYLK